MNFDQALPFILKEEGGYVNNPKDPGGATDKGITQRVYDGYRAGIGKPKKAVKGITMPEVKTIYKKQYWDPIQGDALPAGLDLAVFDFGVNSGTGQAVKELQRCVGAEVDGILGAVTLGKCIAVAKQGQGALQTLIDQLATRRMGFLRKLTTFSTFGDGWTGRVRRITAAAKTLATGAQPAVVSAAQADVTITPVADYGDPETTAKAEPSDKSVATDPHAQGVGMASLGAFIEFVNNTAHQLLGFAQANPWITGTGVALLLGGVGMMGYSTLKGRQ